jgi:hypothetical protein
MENKLNNIFLSFETWDELIHLAIEFWMYFAISTHDIPDRWLAKVHFK